MEKYCKENKKYVNNVTVIVLATNFIILWSVHIFVMIEKNYSRDTVTPSPTPIIKFNELMNSNDVEILKSLTKEYYQNCLLLLNLSQRTVYSLLLFLYLSIFFPYPYLISMIICKNLILYLMYQCSGL